MVRMDTIAKASDGHEMWPAHHTVLIPAQLDCPDPWVSTGSGRGGRGLSRKASFSRGSSRGRGRGKKAVTKPRSKTGAFRAADDD